MKRFYAFLLVSLCFCALVQAQQIQPDPSGRRPHMNLPVGAQPDASTSTTQCGLDTITYPYSKSSSLRLLSVNSANSAAGLCQYFDAPQEITLHGLSFYAYAPSQPNPVQVRVAVYKADTDSLPTGTPVFVDTVGVDSLYGTGSLIDLVKKVPFPNPITINYPYVITIENPSANNISVVTNDFDTTFLGPDGDFEWLSSAKFASPPPNGTWERSYLVNVGGIPFNADVLLHPWVTYELQSLFVADKTCLTTSPVLVNFFGFPSPVATDRMYNSLYLTNQSNLILRYDFGDASPLAYAHDTSHTYATTGPFTSSYTVVMNGYYNFCNDAYSVVIGGAGLPSAYFQYSTLGFAAHFTNYTSGGTSFFYDFGNGSNAAASDPTQVYDSNGTYIVTLIATNACGTDTFIDTVVINCTDPPVTAGFSPTQSGFLVSFSNTSTYATQYFWDFGDGSYGYTANPGHIYASTGNYVVTLIARNLCYADTITDTVFAGVIGIDPGNSQGFSMWPNPATNTVKLRLDAASFDVELLDLNGRLILRKENNAAGVDVPLSLEGISPGLYVVQLKSGEDLITGKLRIE